MPVRFQLVIDCANPDLLARFWAAALGYELAPAPAGFASWNDFYREVGVPEAELVDGADRICDPEGEGPSIWFHVVPDAKGVKNRLHVDIHASGDWRDPIATRRRRVDAEAQPPGRSGSHHHWRAVRGRARPLRSRDEGPGGQRVRYQLTARPEASGIPRAKRALCTGRNSLATVGRRYARKGFYRIETLKKHSHGWAPSVPTSGTYASSRSASSHGQRFGGTRSGSPPLRVACSRHTVSPRSDS